jgi:hypothetical protein
MAPKISILGAKGSKTGGAPIAKGVIRVAFWGVLTIGLTAGVGKFFGTVICVAGNKSSFHVDILKIPAERSYTFKAYQFQAKVAFSRLLTCFNAPTHNCDWRSKPLSDGYL